MEQTDININWDELEKLRDDYKILMEKSVSWYTVAREKGVEADEAKEIAGEHWEKHKEYLSSLDRRHLEALAMRLLEDLHQAKMRLEGWKRFSDLQQSQKKQVRRMIAAIGQKASSRGRRAADARHNAPGEARDKANQIRKIWATGKYTSRDICAEQECAAIGMSFSSARKALRNTPTPI